MKKVSYEQVRRIADLAKLRIDDGENQRLQADMGSILAFADQLTQLDIENVPPTTHAVLIQNVFREDELADSLERDSLLAQAPAQNGECFVVPKVVD